MSKKHYVAIAKVIKELGDYNRTRNTERLDEDIKLAVRFSALFRAENPRFKEHLFLKACGF